MGRRGTKELTEATQRLETSRAGDGAGSSVARPGAAGPRGANEAPRITSKEEFGTMITRRASVTALVAVAVAGLASGCLSSGGSSSSSGEGTASGPGKSTIEVMYGLGPDTEPGFKADVQAWAGQNGITVKFTKAASWDTEIRARVAGGNPPDVGLFPQPGLGSSRPIQSASSSTFLRAPRSA